MKQLTALMLAAALALPAAAAPAKPGTASATRRVQQQPAPRPAGWALLVVGGLLTGLGMFRRPAYAEVFSQPS